MSRSSHPSSKFVAYPSRRDFVKNSSALVVGSAALAAGIDAAKAAHIAGDDEIKVALIGCGGRGTKAAVQALNTSGKVTLWAMADAFE
ncbi:MAG: twin-arginine translocation signal domain-containing protein, partial [Bythopirellula sp.]